MKVFIEKGSLAGSITAPPSKSYAHREMICAALSKEPVTVKGISGSEDMLATLDCLSALGAGYQKEDDIVRFEGRAAGNSGSEVTEVKELPVYKCRESGSTIRFFIPIALVLTGGGTFIGAERLIDRGIGVYEKIFDEQGISFKKEPDRFIIEGSLKPGDYVVPGDISSQFITGLLFALPMLDGDSDIYVTEPVESRAYIDITLDCLKKFGVRVEENEKNHFYIPGSQSYSREAGNDSVVVEGDWSNGAFLYALNSLGSQLEIDGLDPESVQGDKICVEYLGALDECSCSEPENGRDADLIIELAKENGQAIDISGCPDLGPVLFATAAAKHGAVFTGIRRLRIKESDRAVVMQQELAKFGIRSEVFENDMIIYSGKLQEPTEILQGHNDHRIVMSLAVLTTLTGGIIDEAEASRKSYPTFFSEMKRLGMRFSKDADEI